MSEKEGIFETLRQKHIALTRKLNEASEEERSALVPEVREFIEEMRRAGSHIYKVEERDFLRSFLRFWGDFVLEQTRETLNTEPYPAEKPLQVAVLRERARRIHAQDVLLWVVVLALMGFIGWLLVRGAGEGRATPTPTVSIAFATPTPTSALPFAFAPAGPDETLVIIAKLQDISPTATPTLTPEVSPSPTLTSTLPQAATNLEEGLMQAQVGQFAPGEGLADPQAILLTRIRERMAETPKLRFEAPPETITDPSRARQIGELYQATLVLWGSFDGPHATVYVENTKRQDIPLTAETRLLYSLPPLLFLRASLDDEKSLTYLVSALTGDIYYWMGLYERARYAFEEALAALPGGDAADVYFYAGLASLKSPTPNPSLAAEHFNQAITSYMAKVQAEGQSCHALPREAYQTALALCSRLAGAYNSRGLARAGERDYEKALADYDQAIQVGDELLRYYERNLESYRDRASLLVPQKFEALNNRAIAYAALRENDEAEEDFSAAAKLDWPQVYQNWGNFYFQHGEHGEAREFMDGAMWAYSQVLALMEFAPTYLLRGNAYFNLGNYEQAIADYTAAIRLREDYAEAYYWRGMAYRKLGKKEEAVGDFVQYIDLSPDGPGRRQAEAYIQDLKSKDRIAFVTNRDGNREIYSMSSDGRDLSRLTNDPADDLAPAWTFDGQNLVFVSKRGGNADIYRMYRTGIGVKQLTTDPADDGAPDCDPHGLRIVFDSYRDGNWEIYLMNWDGSGQTRLTDDPADDNDPAWSTNNEIAFATNRWGNWDIYVMRIESFYPLAVAEPVPIIASLADDWTPAWSLDSEWLAFTSNRDGNPEIYIARRDGTEVKRLTYNDYGDYNPSWSSDGRIAFYSDRDGDRDIYIMNSDGTGQMSLTANDFDDLDPAWSPAR